MARFCILLSLVLGLLSGCSHSPRIPSDVPVELYRHVATTSPAFDEISLHIVGIRSINGGVYVDLLFHGPRAVVPQYAIDRGSNWSFYSEPTTSIEIANENHELIPLQKMKLPFSGFHLNVHPNVMVPGEFLVESGDAVTWVQVVVLRSSEPVRPGSRYFVRLLGPAKSEASGLPVTKDTSWHPVVAGDARRSS